MHGGPRRPGRVDEPVRQQAVAYGYACLDNGQIGPGIAA